MLGLCIILATHVVLGWITFPNIVHAYDVLGCRIHDNVAMETNNVTWDFSYIKTQNKAPADLTAEGSNWLSTPCGIAIL